MRVTIEVHIDELVLHAIPQSERHRFAVAIEGELQELFGGPAALALPRASWETAGPAAHTVGPVTTMDARTAATGVAQAVSAGWPR